jgi:UDP-galactopyranose mutase
MTSFGKLNYKFTFEHTTLDVENYQRKCCSDYNESEVPYTRIRAQNILNLELKKKD